MTHGAKVTCITIANTALQLLFQVLISLRITNGGSLDLLIAGMATYYFMLFLTQSVPTYTLTPILIKTKTRKLRFRLIKTSFIRAILYYVITLIILFFNREFLLDRLFGFEEAALPDLKLIFSISLICIFITGINGFTGAVLQQMGRFTTIVSGLLIANLLQVITLLSIDYLEIHHVPIIIAFSQVSVLIIYVFRLNFVTNKEFWCARTIALKHRNLLTVLGSTTISKLDGLIDRIFTSFLGAGQLTSFHYSLLILGSVSNISSRFLAFKSLNDFSKIQTGQDYGKVYRLLILAVLIGVTSSVFLCLILYVLLDPILLLLSRFEFTTSHLSVEQIVYLSLLMLPVLTLGLINTVLSNLLHARQLHTYILILNFAILVVFSTLKLFNIQHLTLEFLVFLMVAKSTLVFLGLIISIMRSRRLLHAV